MTLRRISTLKKLGAAIGGLAALLGILTALGFRTPAQELRSIRVAHVALAAEVRRGDSALATVDSSTNARVDSLYQLTAGLARYRCLHTGPTELAYLGLPCDKLLPPRRR